ncbi:Uncharacterised protein [Zhongshania aliphaticivorans]|uniref:Styrene-oxide isomerase n=1 Tax=Zhongshania aliphaticivorans TaxID=1470434 RepID=A0A5S9Q3F3_9GAMM|nr:hypothetical protein [Zhongshania aliphaticivorans]CAA0111489.1 Uncharacterised protein [Zhongshania aliphaticivorans]CAA0118656.1 Uncharacterised protein [Zhongshania aliphaticivorans]
MNEEILKYQRILVINGTLILLIGFIIGFGFLFFITGEISLFPIPGKIEYQVPGTYDAWRMAHMECIVNGLMLWLIAALLPVFLTFVKSIRWLTITPLIISWTIIIASAIDPLFENARGLIFDENSNLMNALAFFLFYPGVTLSFVFAIGILLAAWKYSKNHQQV